VQPFCLPLTTTSEQKRRAELETYSQFALASSPELNTELSLFKKCVSLSPTFSESKLNVTAKGRVGLLNVRYR
jgi:hypothetical protein